MAIKYIGSRDEACQMCNKYKGKKPMYLDNKKLIRALFPDQDWEAQIICEPCAQRESGKKKWKSIKRGT
jgi:hypothetical protein